MATGLGKTLLLYLLQKFRPKRLCFVYNNHILKHALDEFRLVLMKTKMVTNGMSKDGAKIPQTWFLPLGKQ